MPPRTAEQRALLLKLGYLAVTDPARYAEEAFGIRMWPTQLRIIRAFFKYPETVVRSCHASGKTFCLGVIGATAPPLKPDSVLMTISSSWEQVEKTIWGEIHARLANSCVVGWPKPLQTEWRLSPRQYALGLSPDNPTRVHGFHAEWVGLLLDEIAGIENAQIFEAVDSLRASGDSHVIYCMNPTRASGPEVDIWNRIAATNPAAAITIDAFETPNFHDPELGRYITEDELAAMPLTVGGPLDYREPTVGKHLITRRYAREILDTHGKGPASPWWARVRGVFPQQDFSALILQEWIEAAVRNEERQGWAQREAQGYGLVIGLDVAGPGQDLTAWTVRRGPLVVEQGAYMEADPTRSRVRLRQALAPWLAEPGLVINADAGGDGFGLAQSLAALGVQVNPISWGYRAFNAERFANRKAEQWWELRERFREGRIAGRITKACQQQLASMQYEETASGLVSIESKKAMRKRGLHSPDEADSLCLAFASQAERKPERAWSVAVGYKHEEAEKKPSRWMARRRQARREKIGQPAG